MKYRYAKRYSGPVRNYIAYPVCSMCRHRIEDPLVYDRPFCCYECKESLKGSVSITADKSGALSIIDNQDSQTQNAVQTRKESFIQRLKRLCRKML